MEVIAEPGRCSRRVADRQIARVGGHKIATPDDVPALGFGHAGLVWDTTWPPATGDIVVGRRALTLSGRRRSTSWNPMTCSTTPRASHSARETDDPTDSPPARPHLEIRSRHVGDNKWVGLLRSRRFPTTQANRSAPRGRRPTWRSSRQPSDRPGHLWGIETRGCRRPPRPPSLNGSRNTMHPRRRSLD